MSRSSIAIFLLFQALGDFVNYSMNMMNDSGVRGSQIDETEEVLKDHVLQ
jgi:hypothetical protein